MTADMMDRADRWLLDVVATFRIPVRWLVARNVSSLLNRESHGLTAPEVAQRMRGLRDAGCIVASTPVQFGGDRLSLSGHELAKIILSPSAQSVYYGLTESGGALWEAAFHPIWDLYVDALEGCNPERVEVAAMSRELVEDYVAHVYNTSWATVQPIPDSVTWRQIKPWQATYWKVLPYGWRIEFLARPPDPNRAVGLSVEQRGEFHRGEAFLQRIRRWRGDSGTLHEK